MTDSNTILRHLLSTIAYRLTKAIHNIDATFLQYATGSGVRRPIEIIAHMCSVMNYCIAAIEQKTPENLVSLGAEEEIKRFYDLLKKADSLLTEHEIALDMAMKLVQGPLSDALTHVGQIAMLRRYYNKPIQRENFMKARIQVGNTDRESQTLDELGF